MGNIGQPLGNIITFPPRAAGAALLWGLRSPGAALAHQRALTQPTPAPLVLPPPARRPWLLRPVLHPAPIITVGLDSTRHSVITTNGEGEGDGKRGFRFNCAALFFSGERSGAYHVHDDAVREEIKENKT